MAPLRLRSEPNLPLLIADLVVLWFVLDAARLDGGPTWFSVLCLLVAALAAAFAVRSLVLLVRQRRRPVSR